jgi:hypothetical protein
LQPRISFGLQRLKHHDNQAADAQMGHHTAFVAAGRLDADAPDMGAPQRRGQALPTRHLVLHRQLQGVAVNGHLELVLGGIDPGGKRGSI